MEVDSDIYLEHYGKKGMKWGVRNKPKELSDKASRNSNFYNARAAVRSAKSESDRAKARYYTNKAVAGRSAAKKILKNEKRANKEVSKLARERQTKYGRERALARLKTVGKVSAGSLALVAVAALAKSKQTTPLKPSFTIDNLDNIPLTARR